MPKDPLTPFETAMVNQASHVFTLSDPCSIATFVGTRSCADICAYIRQGVAEGPVCEVAAPDEKLSGKRKARTRWGGPKKNQKPALGVHRGKKSGSKRRRSRDSLNGSDSDGENPNEEDATCSSLTLRDYTPCDHDGPCTMENCLCIQSGSFCEKFCQCPGSCDARYRGCRCHGECNSKACPCYGAMRECDPDVCGCSANEFTLFEAHDGLQLPDIHSDTLCKNIALQRQHHKRLKVSPSEIAGWGIFLGEPANKGWF